MDLRRWYLVLYEARILTAAPWPGFSAVGGLNPSLVTNLRGSSGRRDYSDKVAVLSSILRRRTHLW